MPTLRVFVVENDSLLRMHVEALVSELGHVVVGRAATADAAVTGAQLHRPDVVLMDIELDGARDGIDAAREIAETLAIPSVFVTGMAASEVQMRALSIRPLGYLQKPLDTAKLEKALATAVPKAPGLPLAQEEAPRAQAPPASDSRKG